MISRRAFAALIIGVAAGASGAGHTQQNPRPASTKRAARIGLLSTERTKTGLLQELHDLGYDEGRNLIVEHRPNEPAETLARFVAELVALNVDVIVASGSQAVRAAQQATTSIPIVTTGSSDPVGTGLVASLGRPGGNVTGMSLFNPVLSGKRRELLSGIAGAIPRVAVLWDPDYRHALTPLRQSESAS